ncbi:hypothetical protein N7517_007421 [Penicillium concentricum]|uniref:Uncharacterized protein n=1 Tax=Penicillium concentricum TaxID=293559 RepID=A0A9W9VDE8_9EURO|nr:uncharacterized protein N7517_007421 [Penicillium concentricum]KAJ5375415.1 hypothetical protein N7517_007421 [Penicillium concentricum]
MKTIFTPVSAPLALQSCGLATLAPAAVRDQFWSTTSIRDLVAWLLGRMPLMQPEADTLAPPQAQSFLVPSITVLPLAQCCNSRSNNLSRRLGMVQWSADLCSLSTILIHAPCNSRRSTTSSYPPTTARTNAVRHSPLYSLKLTMCASRIFTIRWPRLMQ